MPKSAGTPPRSGGRILIDQLALHGVELIFGVPGESYLAALDALRDSPIRFVNARHEAGAANMAEAAGKLTGRPGVCFVTRGPGATQGSVGVHTAFQDSTPLIYLVGQVPRAELGREALQEVDFEAMFAPLAKWAVQIEDAARIPEIVHRAFQVATSGRPGPVVIALPEDMLAASSDAPDAPAFHRVQPSPAAADIDALRDLLAGAKRPFAIIGGGGWTPGASKGMRAFLEANELSAGAAFRRQDAIDNDSPSYAGDVGIGINPALAERVRDADVLLVVGPRLGEMTTSGYTLLEVPRPRQTLVHVHPGAEELGRVYQPDLPILAGMEHFASAVSDVRVEPRWAASTAQARADYEAWQHHEPMLGPVDLGEVLAQLRVRVPAAIVCNGAGNHTAWVHRFWRFHDYPSQLAPTSGAMGYGVPAAVAAKVVHPERDVICFAGDGDFLMSGQELATAAQYDLPIVVLLVNNGMYGTIRMHQERHFPGRVVGTDLVNPDFAAYARAFGAHGETVTQTSEFAPALERALAAATSAVIELQIDPDAINPRMTLSKIRADASK